jgi:hypothetical protein
MRLTFLAAAAFWATALIILMFVPARLPGYLLLVGAVALTMLWLAHLWGFALRAATGGAADGPAGDRPEIDRGRREMLESFAKAFLWIAAASAFAATARPASAEGRCTNPAEPYPCAQWCCGFRSTYICEGYTGLYTPWRQLGTFCTNASSEEALADLRSNCAVLYHC